MASELLSVATALALVRRHTQPLPSRRVPLLECMDRILAEDIAADADSPPFTKALMDGYAVRSADLPGGQGSLAVIEEIAAGGQPRRTVEAGQASRIMTGAMVPPGADAVVPFEQTEDLGSQVRILAKSLRPGANIMPRGQEMHAGEILFRSGRVLTPQDLGLLATVGCAHPLVHPQPRVAILSTGDEIVSWESQPGPGQIRNSNGPMLFAQVLRAGGRPHFLGIAPDDPEQLKALVKQGLQFDVMILSGGVSAGKRDHVPEVLAELGITAHFHKVALKPGKPLLFGTQPVVFGLPGNPVSGFVCFELFVRPALAILAGRAAESSVHQARLLEPCSTRGDRPTYHPGWLDRDETGPTVRLVRWLGSADLRGLGGANALVVLPAGEHRLEAGTTIEVVPLQTSEVSPC